MTIKTIFPLALGGILLIGVVLLQMTRTPESAAPDFGSMQDVGKKKQTFFSYLAPMIVAETEAILEERKDLERIYQKLVEGMLVGAGDQKLLAGLGVKYRVPDREQLSTLELAAALLPRIDEVPIGLALAQAANESAWGTSRFARSQNNFFGLWCFTDGCGVKPRRAAPGARHRVAAFDTVQGGAAYYLLTLNSHPAYEDLRVLRSGLRSSGAPVTGQLLAEGLLRYSERGRDYVEEIRAMIRVNGLDAL
jgi:Bax protein